MAKDKLITCEVLTTVKGLDPKAPKEYTHAGPADNPTLIDLPDNSTTTALVDAGTIRIYPGPAALPQLPESDKVKALQAKLEGAEKTFEGLQAELTEVRQNAESATVAAGKLTEALQAVVVAVDLETAVNRAKEALV